MEKFVKLIKICLFQLHEEEEEGQEQQIKEVEGVGWVEQPRVRKGLNYAYIHFQEICELKH